MYGTVARMKLKAGQEDAMLALLKEFEGLNVPGFVGEYMYRADSGSNEYWMVAVFQDRESYVKNAESEQMHQFYLRYRALLEEEPEWHDGEIVYAFRRSA